MEADSDRSYLLDVRILFDFDVLSPQREDPDLTFKLWAIKIKKRPRKLNFDAASE